jgi:hypothetical protein
VRFSVDQTISAARIANARPLPFLRVSKMGAFEIRLHSINRATTVLQPLSNQGTGEMGCCGTIIPEQTETQVDLINPYSVRTRCVND